MATITPRYTTVDGKEFKDKAAADMHEMGIEMKEELEAYMSTVKIRATTERGVTLSHARLRKTILKFLTWQRERQLGS